MVKNVAVLTLTWLKIYLLLATLTDPPSNVSMTMDDRLKWDVWGSTGTISLNESRYMD